MKLSSSGTLSISYRMDVTLEGPEIGQFWDAVGGASAEGLSPIPALFHHAATELIVRNGGVEVLHVFSGEQQQ